MLAAILAVAMSFPPFNVGPPNNASNAVHITIWAETPTAGRARCLEELAYWAPADCRVEPATWAPDPSQPGWAG